MAEKLDGRRVGPERSACRTHRPEQTVTGVSPASYTVKGVSTLGSGKQSEDKESRLYLVGGGARVDTGHMNGDRGHSGGGHSGLTLISSSAPSIPWAPQSVSIIDYAAWATEPTGPGFALGRLKKGRPRTIAEPAALFTLGRGEASFACSPRPRLASDGVKALLPPWTVPREITRISPSVA
ncbi:hypothetical protein CSOJ01_12232 [Colletotrichum sojae]|uniref:Uncharacterized protein n=1 Tax=Colletotrichum sojae TaxID=2175907 RepID=A0A8H6IVD7_9PEZI|nr:hypothetical protein CSOJ01_12232 [Colletotrichum sojae]